VLRRRLGHGVVHPPRVAVRKARWLDDALSPVMLQIDDLANAWHNRNGSGRWDPGGDWGGGMQAPGSALRFLEEHLLADFPEAKVTFFTVAGPLSPYTRHQPFSHSAALDETADTRDFFRSLAEDPRFELAYHGYNHGIAGSRSEDFRQEWRAFESVEEAVEQTRRGLDIFLRATGERPRGGKYGGWEYNAHAEHALERCGFTWWCRDYTPRDVAEVVHDAQYEPQLFGESLMVALPTTLHGHFWSRRQVDLLLEHQQLVAITEHIAPLRPDGLVQTPNIVDDMEELRRLYRYLRRYRVWHATGSEIAAYVIARERTLVHDVTRDGFSLRYEGPLAAPLLTLLVDCKALCSRALPLLEVVLPDGSTLDPQHCRFDRSKFRHRLTVPVISGRYRLRAIAEPSSKPVAESTRRAARHARHAT
jgi:peptidoglycan/xylan/chitin deacetylase (PgdA/CDA1 family)